MHEIAIIGTGLMAEIYADILLQRGDCRIVTVCGNSEEATNRFASKYGVPCYYAGNVDEMYKNHPQVQISVITTPEWVREKPLSAALKYNQHILLEKPFAQDYETAKKISLKLEGCKKVFDICHVLRFSPRFQALKQVIDQGGIGEIRHIYARRNSNRQRVLRVLGKTDLAFWLTPHDVDMMRWLTKSEVVEVYARSRGKLKDDDDYLIANIRFANGVDAVLEISWCTPPISPSAPEARFEIWGTHGSAELDDSDMNLRIYSEGCNVASPDTYEDFLIHGLRQGFFKNMVDAFIARVRRDDTAGNSVVDAIRPIMVCDMIRRSLDEERVVGI